MINVNPNEKEPGDFTTRKEIKCDDFT